MIYETCEIEQRKAEDKHVVAKKEDLPDFDLGDGGGFLERNYTVILLKGVWFKNTIHLIATWSLALLSLTFS